MNLEKAVEPQKSAKGTKYQPFTALGAIMPTSEARGFCSSFFLRFLRFFAAIQSPFL
jgi:hypothetical protein